MKNFLIKNRYILTVSLLIVVIVVSSIVIYQNVMAATAISQWDFISNPDDSVSGHNATLAGGAIIANGYLALPGNAGDKAVIADDDDFSFTDGLGQDQPFSIATWVNLGDAEINTIVAKAESSVVKEEYRLQILDLATPNTATVEFSLLDDVQSIGASYSDLSKSIRFPEHVFDDEWVFVVVTYDGSELDDYDTIDIYLNGYESEYFHNKNKHYAYTGMQNTLSDLTIGSMGDDTNPTEGGIARTRIFSGELTPAEIKTLYDAEAQYYRGVEVIAEPLDASADHDLAPSSSLDTFKIRFTPVYSLDINDTVTIDFDGFNVPAGLVVGDLSVSQENEVTDITIDTFNLISSGAGGSFSFDIASAGDQPAGEVTLLIAGITNPVAGQYNVNVQVDDLASGDTDIGAAEVWIGISDVELLGVVDPYLTLILDNWYKIEGGVPVAGSPNTCQIGTLYSNKPSGCAYSAEVATNADSGFVAYIREIDDLKNSYGTAITKAASSTGYVKQNFESYGIITISDYTPLDITQITDLDGDTFITELDCLQGITDMAASNTSTVGVSPLSTDDQSFLAYDNPIDTDPNYICHFLSVSGDTDSGVYSHSAIITAVAKF